jgi:hypothetical protein
MVHGMSQSAAQRQRVNSEGEANTHARQHRGSHLDSTVWCVIRLKRYMRDRLIEAQWKKELTAFCQGEHMPTFVTLSCRRVTCIAVSCHHTGPLALSNELQSLTPHVFRCVIVW